jgi:pimeloyl-ACP methyl ester carboxylesterase
MKPHLLLVHSFPTNSVLLHGLEEFLSDFFTVHFVDLPGFHKNNPPFVGDITLKKFSNYFDEKIAELDVDEYIVAGVSFGFLVINNARLDKRCKAVVAMEPFVNTTCLNIPFWRQKKYIAISGLLKLVHFLHLEKRIWASNWFNEYLQKESDYPKERVDTIIKHIDPRTFFAVTNLVMHYQKNPKFHNLPYFLIGNFADKTINFDRTVEIFIKNLHELHIASEPIDHYPKDLTKSYFKTRIPGEHIQRMLACIEGGENF